MCLVRSWPVRVDVGLVDLFLVCSRRVRLHTGHRPLRELHRWHLRRRRRFDVLFPMCRRPVLGPWRDFVLDLRRGNLLVTRRSVVYRVCGGFDFGARRFDLHAVFAGIVRGSGRLDGLFAVRAGHLHWSHGLARLRPLRSRPRRA